MRLSDVVAGTRAIKHVKLPLCNAPGDPSADLPELREQREQDGVTLEQMTVMVGVRAIGVAEEESVLVGAHQYARERGVENPNEDSPIYRLGKSIYQCAVACVDPDSDPKRPTAFFGKGNLPSAVEAITHSEHITGEVLAYLAEQVEAWQAEVSPKGVKMMVEDLLKHVDTLAEGDLRPFLCMSWGQRAVLLKLMARMCTASLALSTSSGSGSETGTPSNPKSDDLEATPPPKAVSAYKPKRKGRRR